jgi:sigma-54 dependent transcriptional regulator, acetoin dehydrogenase operon transcriptional activator AcoR
MARAGAWSKLLPPALGSAPAIEANLREHLLAHDQQLLLSLSRAGDVRPAYAVDLLGRRTLLNRAASAELAPADLATLWKLVRRATLNPQLRAQTLRLENHRLMRLQITPVMAGDEPVGAVVTLTEERVRESLGRLEAEDWTPFSAAAKRMSALMKAAHQTCAERAPALLVGEAGVGKTALALAIHRNSRWGGTLRPVDCAAGPGPTELWSALEPAEPEGCGTVVLERIEDLSLPAQAWLVSYLDRGAGGEGPRLLATATADSLDALRAARVRSDLLDRLAANLMLVPPLRERADEIPEIVRQTVREAPAGVVPPGELVRPGVMRALQRYRWPGNVRQLRNVLYQALRLRPRQAIDITALPAEIGLEAGLRRDTRFRRIELDAILHALHDCGGNVSSAAQQLGLSRATLYRRLGTARNAFDGVQPR